MKFGEEYANLSMMNQEVVGDEGTLRNCKIRLMYHCWLVLSKDKEYNVLDT